jgi:1,2-diacylglycerol 3-alpha-glucosyltransferase
LNRFKSGFEWLLWQWMLDLFNRLDAVTAPSHTAATILRRQGLETPVHPLSCGVDLETYRLVPNLDRRILRERYGLDPERTTFLFVGRVDAEKRLDVLLQALRRLDRVDVQLAVAGRGAAVDNLKSLASRLGVREQVRFLGFVPDIDLPALLNSVDIFAMPSEAELLSIATLEAMACGRPVLAARARALPELVTDGENGYLFEAGNPASAAHAMDRLANSPECWPAMGAASLRKAQSHSLDNSIRRYEDFYQMVLSRVPVQSPPDPTILSPRITKRLQQLVTQLWQ